MRGPGLLLPANPAPAEAVEPKPEAPGTHGSSAGARFTSWHGQRRNEWPWSVRRYDAFALRAKLDLSVDTAKACEK